MERPFFWISENAGGRLAGGISVGNFGLVGLVLLEERDLYTSRTTELYNVVT